MPDLPSLFAYEHEIESAWQTILAQNNVNAFIEATDETKTTPYVDVQLQNSSVFPDRERGHRHVHQGVQYFDFWQGTLLSTVWTKRGVNSDQQIYLVSKVRAFALPENFNNILQSHVVKLVEEVGSAKGVDKAQLLDWMQIHHLVTFGIRPNAWP